MYTSELVKSVSVWNICDGLYPLSEVANLGEHSGPVAGLTDLGGGVVGDVRAEESLQPDPACLGVDEGRAGLSLI